MWIVNLFYTVVLPILIAVATYWLQDTLGEYKKRRNYSRLGVAIIDTLLEEINTGVDIMTRALQAVETSKLNELPLSILPNNSWEGMTTITDEVLLRIIATSEAGKFEAFPPKECRMHCKNYFVNIKPQYDQALTETIQRSEAGADWRKPLHDLLSDDGSKFLEASLKVKRMLEDARKLLEENAKIKRPK